MLYVDIIVQSAPCTCCVMLESAKEADAILLLSMYNKQRNINCEIRGLECNDIFGDTTHSCCFGLYFFSGISFSGQSGGNHAGLCLRTCIGALCAGDDRAAVVDRLDCGIGGGVVWHLAGEQAAGTAK